MSIVSVVILVTIYCKISRKIKAATHLTKQSMILAACLLVNVAISVLVNLSLIKHNLYIYGTIVSLYDITYPIGFLVVLKYPALLAVMRQIKKQKKKQPPLLLPKSQMNATAPFSDRVSPRSTTVPITFQNTGAFTDV